MMEPQAFAVLYGKGYTVILERAVLVMLGICLIPELDRIAR